MKRIVVIIKPPMLDDVREAGAPPDGQGRAALGTSRWSCRNVRPGSIAALSPASRPGSACLSPGPDPRYPIRSRGGGRREAPHTGKIGDGKIFVIDIERAMRIRTGEVDAEAL